MESKIDVVNFCSIRELGDTPLMQGVPNSEFRIWNVCMGGGRGVEFKTRLLLLLGVPALISCKIALERCLKLIPWSLDGGFREPIGASGLICNNNRINTHCPVIIKRIFHIKWRRIHTSMVSLLFSIPDPRYLKFCTFYRI